MIKEGMHDMELLIGLGRRPAPDPSEASDLTRHLTTFEPGPRAPKSSLDITIRTIGCTDAPPAASSTDHAHDCRTCALRLSQHFGMIDSHIVEAEFQLVKTRRSSIPKVLIELGRLGLRIMLVLRSVLNW